MNFDKLKELCIEVPIDASISANELFDSRKLYTVPSESKPVKIIIDDEWNIVEQDGIIEFTRESSAEELIYILINEIKTLRDEIDRLKATAL